MPDFTLTCPRLFCRAQTVLFCFKLRVCTDRSASYRIICACAWFFSSVTSRLWPPSTCMSITFALLWMVIRCAYATGWFILCSTLANRSRRICSTISHNRASCSLSWIKCVSLALASFRRYISQSSSCWADAIGR